MKKIALILLVFIGQFVNGQNLLQIQATTSPALCRTASFQNGNGVISITVTGGTPSYSYAWVNLQNGNTFGNNSTWSGLNPGQYQVTVTDMANNSLVDTIQLDSINPIADFEAVSAQLNPVPGGYAGFDSAFVQFENTSLNFADTIVPSDTIFIWNLNVPDPTQWFFSYDYSDTYTASYLPGVYQIGLATRNYNDCRDTIIKTITISTTLNISTENSIPTPYTLIPNYENQHIQFKQLEAKSDLVLKVYNLKGQLILNTNIQDSAVDIPFNAPRGVYIYEVINTETNSALAGNHKFVF